MNTERRSFLERVTADGFIALALVHHLCISNNIPLAGFAEFLSSFGSSGIVEWVAKEDEMVQELLKNRTNIFVDYSWENFRACIEKHFDIVDICDLKGGKRRLCQLSRRNSVHGNTGAVSKVCRPES